MGDRRLDSCEQRPDEQEQAGQGQVGRRDFLRLAGAGVAATSVAAGALGTGAAADGSLPAGAATRQATEGGTMQVTLNGLVLTLDETTGSILACEHPGPGRFLECAADLAGLVDMAYPIPEFPPLRLASRFSSGAQIDLSESRAVVSWERLGASRDVFALPGAVSAEVTVTALPDGASVTMSCRITNHSSQPIPQVVFPDLNGLLPVAGPERTILKTGGFGRAPFVELRMDEARRSTQFCIDIAYGAAQYESGGMFHPMWLCWLDLGGLAGGFSLFPKRWGWEPRAAVRVHHWEEEDKLRLLCVHNLDIAQGETWESGEYVLTPHRGGWAKGIEPYWEWVRAHTSDRPWPMPKHVREGLGYRTVWMSQGFPDDPLDAVWSMEDLPAVAAESHAHGLDEMVIWGAVRGFELPLPDPFPHLGTLADFAEAVRRCRAEGVNAAPFISVLQAGETTAHKYGLTVPETGGWPQHTETVPRFQAPYLPLYRCAQVDTANQLWQREVIESCRRYIEAGIPSISWDQYWSTPEGHMTALGAQIRDIARARDPESTFSGEELWNLEADWRELDYTWNWGSYRDCQAFTSAFPAPRVSCNVSSCPITATRAFLDNLYLNVFPRKAGSVNGSDWIESYPDLSASLRRCAALRRSFLRYFVDGVFVGDCVLRAECAAAHVSAYVLAEGVLVMAMNLGAESPLGLELDLEPWLAPGPSGYQMSAMDDEEAPLAAWVEPGPAFRCTTPPIGYGRVWVCEVRPATA